MTRSELIAMLADKNRHITTADVELVVKSILDEMTSYLSHGDRIEIRGFGAFDLSERRPRIGRNPRTGEKVSIGEKWVPHFKPGKELRQRVNAFLGKIQER